MTRKPIVNDRKMVNNRVKFVSKVSRITPGVSKYFMTDSPNQDTGIWLSIHELRDEVFEDYLMNRPGYFGHQTRKQALTSGAMILIPAVAGPFFGLIFGIIGALVSGALIAGFFMLHYRKFLECCKNSEGPSVT